MEKYPTVSLTELHKLKAIITQAADDPKYLDGRICPYDKPTRELVKSLIVNPVVAATLQSDPDRGRKQVGAPKKGSIIPMNELEQEFDDLRKEIQQLKTDAAGLEPHEKIQVVKTRASLIEKILNMKEGINSVKKTQAFIANVLQIMEDELPQESRLRVMEKLQPYAEEE